MFIVGIDPGSIKMGLSVIRVLSQNPLQLERVSGQCIRFGSDPMSPSKIKLIHDQCREIVRGYNPAAVGIESLIYTRFVKATLVQGQLRGAMIAGLLAHGPLTLYEFSPAKVKLAITGKGSASKEFVAQRLKMLFKRLPDFESDDESDSLAIAVCCALAMGHGPRV